MRVQKTAVTALEEKLGSMKIFSHHSKGNSTRQHARAEHRKVPNATLSSFFFPLCLQRKTGKDVQHNTSFLPDLHGVNIFL